MGRNLKKILYFGMVLFIIFTSIFTTQITYAKLSDEGSSVSLVEVKKAALFQVALEQKTNAKSLWNVNSLKLETPIPVFDNTDTISSYIVNLSQNGKPRGFVEVSSIKDEYQF